MVLEQDSQEFESFVPVYDSVPEKWEDARQFFVEHLKKISNAVNAREIGWLLDEELLSGKQFIPVASMSGTNSSNSQQFRSVLRKVIDLGSLLVGVNPGVAHGIVFDVNFTLIDLWVSATNSTTFIAVTMSDPQNLTMTATTINVTSTGAFDRAFAIVEYIQEI
jgi:hypothetical protein